MPISNNHSAKPQFVANRAALENRWDTLIDKSSNRKQTTESSGNPYVEDRMSFQGTLGGGKVDFGWDEGGVYLQRKDQSGSLRETISLSEAAGKQCFYDGQIKRCASFGF